MIMYIALVESTKKKILVTTNLDKAKKAAVDHCFDYNEETSVYKYNKKTKKPFGDQIEGYEPEEEE